MHQCCTTRETKEAVPQGPRQEPIHQMFVPIEAVAFDVIYLQQLAGCQWIHLQVLRWIRAPFQLLCLIACHRLELVWWDIRLIAPT